MGRMIGGRQHHRRCLSVVRLEAVKPSSLPPWAFAFEDWNVKTKSSRCASTPSLPNAADPSLSRWWCFLKTDEWGPMAWPGDNSHETASVCQHTKEGSHPAGTNNRVFRAVALPAGSFSVADCEQKRPSREGQCNLARQVTAEIPLRHVARGGRGLTGGFNLSASRGVAAKNFVHLCCLPCGLFKHQSPPKPQTTRKLEID